MLELPHDLIEEILCRLPATSLKRLRATCKQWNHLFNDTKFSTKHFDNATKQFMVLTLTNHFRVCLLNVSLHNGVPSVEFTSELSLIDDSNSSQVKIDQVFHCDGLLLCTVKEDTRVVVWNPCTAQTKWIQTGKNRNELVLGYYQDSNTGNKSYRILSYNSSICHGQEFEIYDINSNLWRNLDVTLIPDYHFSHPYYHVSLNGKTYWFGFDEEEEHLGLISFDYTAERFELLHLPYQCDRYQDLYLSVAGEDTLAVLLQRQNSSRKEIWVTTTKIDDETKEMSWNKLLEVDVGTGRDISFLVDVKKKVVVFCEKCFINDHSVTTVSIVGQHKKATQVDFRVMTMTSYWPYLVDYVPSLIQI